MEHLILTIRIGEPFKNFKQNQEEQLSDYYNNTMRNQALNLLSGRGDREKKQDKTLIMIEST